MTNISLIKSNATGWPWSSTTAVSFTKTTTANGWETWQMYDDTANQAMYVTEGWSNPNNQYDLERDSSHNWRDHTNGTNAPKYYIISSSTSVPSSGTSQSSGTQTVQASATNKYLHLYTGGAGIYMGYVDVWTPFQSSGPTVTSINRLTPWTTTIDDGVNPPVSYHLEGEIVTNDTFTSSDVTLAKDFASYANSNLTLRFHSAGNFFGIAKPSDGLYHIAVGDKHNDYLYNDDSWRSAITSSSSTRTTNSTRILNVIASIPFNANIYVRTRKNSLPHQTAFGSWSEWFPLSGTRTREQHRLTYSDSNTTSSGYTQHGFNSDTRVSFVLGNMQDANGDDQIGGRFIVHKWRQDDHNNGFHHTGAQYELGAQSSIYSAAFSNDSSVPPYDKYFQRLVSDTWQYQFRIDDWLFHNEPEGDGDETNQTCDHEYANCRRRRAHSFW